MKDPSADRWLIAHRYGSQLERLPISRTVASETLPVFQTRLVMQQSRAQALTSAVNVDELGEHVKRQEGSKAYRLSKAYL